MCGAALNLGEGWWTGKACSGSRTYSDAMLKPLSAWASSRIASCHLGQFLSHHVGRVPYFGSVALFMLSFADCRTDSSERRSFT
jgi:hypothetical protein